MSSSGAAAADGPDYSSDDHWASLVTNAQIGLLVVCWVLWVPAFILVNRLRHRMPIAGRPLWNLRVMAVLVLTSSTYLPFMSLYGVSADGWTCRDYFIVLCTPR
mgnify:CR=1 FL=1